MNLIALLLTFLSISVQISHGDVDDETLIEKYQLSNARAGQDAVHEAVNFIKSQMSQSTIEATNERSAAAVIRLKAQSYRGSGSNLPLCEVNFDAIINDGSLMFLGNSSQPPYAADCWAMRIRYHTAPVCQLQEDSDGIVPLYRWQWILKSALNGLCSMPDTTLLKAAQAFLLRQERSYAGLRPTASSPTSVYRADTPGKVVNIVMLGLSFLGQPYQSIICNNLADVYVNGSFASNIKGVQPQRLPLADVLKDGGHCTGFHTANITDFYPTELHGNTMKPPRQNGLGCNMEHSMVQFKSKSDPSLPLVRLCYQYTFNMQKNIKPGNKLPCDLEWGDVDVIFALHKRREIEEFYLPRSNANIDQLKHLRIVSVLRIYQGLLSLQARAAYDQHGFKQLELQHYNAKPRDCARPDVHYRMPGVTDHAIRIWLAFLATGMDDEKNAKNCAIRLQQNKQRRLAKTGVGNVEEKAEEKRDEEEGFQVVHHAYPIQYDSSSSVSRSSSNSIYSSAMSNRSEARVLAALRSGKPRSAWKSSAAEVRTARDTSKGNWGMDDLAGKRVDATPVVPVNKAAASTAATPITASTAASAAAAAAAAVTSSASAAAAWESIASGTTGPALTRLIDRATTTSSPGLESASRTPMLKYREKKLPKPPKQQARKHASLVSNPQKSSKAKPKNPETPPECEVYKIGAISFYY